MAVNGRGLRAGWQARAKSSSTRTRVRVAANPGCPPELLEVLAADELRSVAHAALANPSLPVVLMERILDEVLTGAPFASVVPPLRNRGMYGSSMLASRGERDPRRSDGGYLRPWVIARNPSVTGPMLDRIIRTAWSDSSWWGEMESAWLVAEVLPKPACPHVWLELAAVSSQVERRELVAANPALPEHLVRSLAREGNPEVRFQLVQNPAAAFMRVELFSLVTEDQLALLGRWGKGALQEQALDLLMGLVRADLIVESSHVLLGSAQLVAEKSSSVEHLSELCRHPHPVVRWQAAGNPVTRDEDKVWVALQPEPGPEWGDWRNR